MNEEWRDVVGFGGKYRISNLGRLWSCYHKKEMKPTLHLGYHSFLLRRDERSYRKRASRLVYEAFIGAIPNGLQVDHIDRNRLNNHPSNLRCVDGYTNQFNREARRTFLKGRRWGYATRIFGKLYQKIGFNTEQEAFDECERVRLAHVR